MARMRAIDRSLSIESRTGWIVSLVILAIGALILFWVISPGARQRRAAVDRLAVGDPSESVVEVLGDPVECANTSPRRLRPMLPPGWPTAAAGPAMEQLAEETAVRWVYPVDDDDPGSCTEPDGQTEIGIDADGNVRWIAPITGKTPLRLPPEYAPGEFAR